MTSMQMSQTVNKSKIWKMGGVAVVASVAANLIALVILRAILDLPSAAAFPPLSAGAIGFLTAVFTLLAVVVYAVIVRMTENPVRVFWIVATAVFVLSIIPNIISAMNPTGVPFPFPEPSALGFLALIVFHVIAYLVTTWILTTQTVE